VALYENASVDLATAFATGRDRGPWLKHTELTQNLLGDDPGRIFAALQPRNNHAGAAEPVAQLRGRCLRQFTLP
jgi:hypothetical protein